MILPVGIFDKQVCTQQHFKGNKDYGLSGRNGGSLY